MEYPASDFTNTHAWAGEDWKLSSANLGAWHLIAFASVPIVAPPPPAAAKDYRSSDDSAIGVPFENMSAEDAEDLADGLATLRKYESEGADVFVRYRDYANGRSK
ncbi:MAG: hypothetical protein E2P02_02650 [Acidobacteria bacterium]|nr:MAG: hypothetical protein E2P02_02650 [Acidobacteriota bacterium]